MSEQGWLLFWNLTLLFALKALCFVLGYLIVRIGADLLRQGIKGEFKFSGTLTGAKADLKSASPGLLFLLLGVALIGYAMWVPKTIFVEYSPKVEKDNQKVMLPFPDLPSSSTNR